MVSSVLVPNFAADAGGPTNDPASAGQRDATTSCPRQVPSDGDQTATDGMSAVRQHLPTSGLDARTVDTTMASWRPSIHKQYKVYIWN